MDVFETPTSKDVKGVRTNAVRFSGFRVGFYAGVQPASALRAVGAGIAVAIL
jgi:hypothetical protein